MTDLFQPLDDHPAYRLVANAIEHKIVARTLRTGDPLPSEMDLARQFGVNRSTVREAIRELETHGLLGRGRGEKRLRVTRPQPQTVSFGVSRALALHDVTFHELWEAMMALEPAAAEHAALRRTEAQLRAITRAAKSFARAGTTTAEAVASVVDFFTAVALASGNRVLAMSQAPLNALLAPALSELIDRVSQARTRIQVAQQKISSAIKLRQDTQARSWMEKHIQDFKRGHELVFPVDADRMHRAS